MVATRDLGHAAGRGGGAGDDGRDWLGDRSCLDFVNTYRADRERLDGLPDRGDRLHTPNDLADWLHEAGLVPSRVPISPAVYDQALELRDAIDAGVDAIVGGLPVPGSTVEAVNAWMERAERQVLSIEGGTPVLRRLAASDFAAAALSQIAIDAARLLGTPERARVRICAGGCGIRFYDRSPAARRRWCSMQRCGNTAKARRFRARGPADAD
jgi:predicted RNA-binding Zn ribbon-like protein